PPATPPPSEAAPRNAAAPADAAASPPPAPAAPAAAPPATIGEAVAPAEAAAPARRSPGGAGRSLIARPACILLRVERLRPRLVVDVVPRAVAVALPAAPRVAVDVAVAVGVVIAVHVRVARLLATPPRHLSPPGGVLSPAVGIAGGDRPAGRGDACVGVVRRPAAAIGVVARVHVLHRAALAGGDASGHGVVGVANLRAPRIPRPRVVATRGARDH